ncbi:DUF349 domain-containing protein [Motiliproteus sp. MSK22-1]|uniref:DUF349 domain-containing protein n=1 Tax=Motiliproteus sp. MSK22-1 TaxID=1897630 RepID=UPI0009769ABE|nr:DUF349 domain-containing protein [Motiliproteus sp. MSK22-1]OMH36279.1 hypothetical protein BGP75_10060 [Motiliproteus sp. MSK22-1]
MQLTFTHFFRPRWQHPKPGIRRKAIDRLKSDLPSDQEILQKLAKLDQDVEVRCSALEKLVHPDLLREIANTDPTPQVRREATNRLCLLLCQPGPENLSAETRASYIDDLNDPDILTHITLNADHSVVQFAAVKRITLETSLQQIIIDSDNFQIRQHAASSIHTPELLEQLIKHCRQGDKGVYRILRERRDQQKQQAKLLAEQQATCKSLCQAIEKLAKEAPNNFYSARFNALLNSWSEYDAVAKESLEKRFELSQAQCQSQLDIFEQTQAEEQLRQQNREQLQRLIDNGYEQVQIYQTQLPDIPELQSKIQELDQQWAVLIQKEPAEKKQLNRFNKLKAEFNQLLDGLNRLEQQRSDLEARLSQSRSIKALLSIRSNIDWPDAYPQPDILQQLDRKVAEQRLKQEQRAATLSQKKQDLDGLLAQLEKTLDEGQLQQSTDYLNRIRNLSDNLGKEFRGAQKQRYQALLARHQELNNWQKFATHPKLERLCEEMEQLVTSDIEVSERASQIKALQQQWKNLESRSIPSALRNRFQQANKAAYTPCQLHNDQQRELRQHNLQQRQQLFDRLKEALSSTDQQTNGQHSTDSIQSTKTLAQLNREARQLWRTFTPVDRAPGKRLQQQFNQLLAEVETKLNAGKEGNAAAKAALLEQAKMLLDQIDKTELKVLLNNAKDLQKQWRNIGPAQRKQEQTLWQEFRGVCNQLFEHRSQSAEAGQNKATDNEQKRATENSTETQHFSESSQHSASASKPVHREDTDWLTIELQHQVCEKLEAQLLTEGSLKLSEEQIESWNQMNPPRSPFAEKMQERFDSLHELSKTPEAIDECLIQSDKQLRLLCIRLEIMGGQSSPADDQFMRMEYQINHLSKALKQQQNGPSDKELNTVKKLWFCTPFNQCHSELIERFTGLLDTLEEH